MWTARNKFQLGLRSKFVALISLLFILMGLVFTWIFMVNAKSYIVDGLQKRGISLAKNLSHDATYGVSVGDTTALSEFVKGVAEEPDIAYVIILNSRGIVWAHNDPAEVGKMYKDEANQKAQEVQELTVYPYRNEKGVEVYEVITPIMLSSAAIGGGLQAGGGENVPATEKIGVIRLGLSTEETAAKLNRLVWVSILLTLVIIGIGIGASTFFVKLIVKPLERMVGAATQVSNGDFTQTLEISSADEVGTLGEAFVKMMGNLKTMVRKIVDVSQDVSMASQKITENSRQVAEGATVQATAVDNTSSSITQMSTSIREIAGGIEVLSSGAEATSSSILQMSAVINEVANNAQELSASVESTSSSVVEMTASIKQVAEAVDLLSSAAEETASAMNEMSASVREVEKNAKDSARLSERATNDAREYGTKAVEKTIDGMKKIQQTVEKSAQVVNKLGQRSEHIGKVLNVIEEVTKQTNLLALNAAILAAQAGEQGKGFAVVADEIKNLADRTAVSTKEISQLITDIQTEAKDAVVSITDGHKSVEEGMKLSLEAGEALTKILESSKKSADMARDIELATVEQSKGIRQVIESMQRITQMVSQIAHATQEQTKGSSMITQAAERMKDITRQVRNSTEEQAKGSKQITKAMENVTERIQQMFQAITEVRKGSEVIVKSVEEIRSISKESVKLATEMNQVVEILSKQSEILQGEIGRFKIM
jgi:methyl-accepting chemotaxis protein